jgi:hypothetical protein
MQDWQDPTGGAVLVGAVVLVVLVAALTVALVRARRATAAVVGQVAAHAADLQQRLDELERRVVAAPAQPRGAAPGPEFVITALGEPDGEAATAGPGAGAAAAPQRIGGALFADLVLRESVVKAAALAHGVRRALDPETRSRIRFEMRREIKRARKERRAEVRAARRVVRARRAAVDPLDDAGTAA